jgi:predicted Fe-Mo cluster-binding NifX family protein
VLILIPVDREAGEAARIVPLASSHTWALVDFDGGEIVSLSFHDDRLQTGADWIDFVILANRFENTLEFMEEGIMVLITRGEETVAEVMEAFKFKELDEAGF